MTQQTRVNLGQKLKQARHEADIKQEHVARYLQVPTSAISMMESGQRKVDAIELFQLSKLFGKSLEWFFDEDHPLSADAGSRWYDSDPLIRECMHLLKHASPDLQKKAAYGLLGFLSPR